MSAREDKEIADLMATQGVPTKQDHFNSAVADWLDTTLRGGMQVHGEIYRARFMLALNAYVDKHNRAR